MSIFKQLAALGLCTLLVTGCSEKTQEATKEALGSAAEDTKVNVKKAGEVLEAGLDKAKEEFKEPTLHPNADDPADADVVPESQEIQP